MGIGGKALATVFTRNDHAEETAVLDELPHMGRHVLLPGRLPVLHQPAQLVGILIEKSLLLGVQCGPRIRCQPPPVRPPAKQLPLPPHRARFKRIALGLRHRR
ncbi:hypothetical protein SDC9_190261 [bioreactor metagenome]|uniref:Uncharacterized protein n=1 Tax=bioreactor metagenome TaxID=1076179 RepID=A0A645I2U7_9ZZZZ